MKDIFAEIGIEISPENKRDIDQQIHQLVGVEYKNCSATWKQIKSQISANREVFIVELKNTLTS